MATNQRRREMLVRRRRSVALAILTVLALVVAFLLWRPWEHVGALVDAVSPSSTTQPSTSATPEPTSDQPYTPVGGVPQSEQGGLCTAEQVVITAMTNATTYASGEEVSMSFTIENVSDAVCTINVGTTEQQYVVRTGQQQVYTSSDCEVDPVDQVVELQPGVAQETIPVVWDRTFSSQETCSTPREQVVAGGASYHLSVTVAGIEAQNTVQFLLY